MKVGEKGIALVKEYEGLRLMPYNCPAGHATIGYGHKIHDGPVTSQDKIKYHGFDEMDAEALLRGDLSWNENALGRRLGDIELSQNEYDALASLHYNIPSAFVGDTGLAKAIKAHDKGRIPTEMLKWVYAAGKPQKGLIRRRAAEVALFKGES